MYILFLYTHLLLYIDNIFLLFPLTPLSYILAVQISHLLGFYLLGILLLSILMVVFLSFYLVPFCIFPFSAIHDISSVLSLYILLYATLPTTLLILFLYYLPYNFLSFVFLLLYVDLDDNGDVLIYLLNFLNFHHIFLSIYILSFYILDILLPLWLLHIYMKILLQTLYILIFV